VKYDDDKDENDVCHEPNIDLLEVRRLGQVFLDGSQQRSQYQEGGEGAHESVGEERRAKATDATAANADSNAKHRVR